MKKVLIFTALFVLVLGTLPASAVTFGEPDYNNHPNVGAMLVGEENAEKDFYCSGTLIAPDVFLTAAHCTDFAAANDVDPHDVWVTFDSVIDEVATLHRGTYHLNPNYGHDMHDLHDVAVIILDEPITDIDPAMLPPAGLLTDMEKSHDLKGQQFVTVGYGSLRDDKTSGPHAIGDPGERFFAEQTFQALKPYWLQLSMNPSTDNGGTCYGDSGGPHFLVDGDSNMVVSLTVTGDTWCRATDVTYRLDTDSARSYLSDFVTLP